MVSLTFGLRHQNLRENFRNNKYKSAQWVKNNIPIESNIASWDCGIFSFFSERPIINLDGLINSRNYYENYLKPKQLHSYLQKREVDYLINQFDPDDNSNRLNLINKEYVQLQEIPILDDFKNYPNGQEFRVFRISYLKPE